METRRGKDTVCPHLPWAEMLIWARLCPFALPPTGDPPAGMGDGVLSRWWAAGCRVAALYRGRLAL